MTNENKPVKLCSLWKNDKANRLVASGKLDGNTRVLIFRVDPEWKKENPNRPDFELCVAKAEKREDTNAPREDSGSQDMTF